MVFLSKLFLFFFFQAEDGIRDLYVTGVQTCALPISLRPRRPLRSAPRPRSGRTGRASARQAPSPHQDLCLRRLPRHRPDRRPLRSLLVSPQSLPTSSVAVAAFVCLVTWFSSFLGAGIDGQRSSLASRNICSPCPVGNTEFGGTPKQHIFNYLLGIICV